ncbi:NAD(P)-binding domain-containing protein [Isoptericola halotolerans]|uniref:NAD(P)-binding domain-containing protein n=1 Tax=Isoptericola halotolerans TaxID=300560 RepID=UPI00388FB9A3
MTVLLVGADLGSATEELLDVLALDTSAEEHLCRALQSSGTVDGAFVLSTCQRTEVYVSTEDCRLAATAVERAWTSAVGSARSACAGALHARSGAAAAAHLFAVVGGRRSVTPGETHVVDQVRGALNRAQRHGFLDAELNTLVQQSLRTSRRIRALAGAGAGSGLAECALQAAGAHVRVGPAVDVLVLGAGIVGRDAARAAARHHANVVIRNRTLLRAQALADEVGGRVASGPLTEALAEADVIVSATSSPTPVVDLTAARAAARSRDGRPQVYVDLARPRDVSADVARLPSVHRVGLHDLGPAGGRARDTAVDAVAVADADEWERARRAAAAGPLLEALGARATEVVEDEVRRVTQLRGTHPADAELLRTSLRRVVNRLLHAPRTRARAHAVTGTLAEYEAALGDLFAAPRRSTHSTSPQHRNPGEVGAR